MPAARSRSGFTVVEVLIAVALIAVISAAVMPQLTMQVGKSQRQRVMSDMVNIGDAATRFYSNVERWPATTEQLSVKITTGNTDLFGRAYTAFQVDQWQGPYLTRPTSGSSILTGGGAAINAAFDTITWNSSLFLRLSAGGVSQQDAREISVLLDGDTVVGDTGTDPAAGRIRWKDSATDSLIYLARSVMF